MAYIDSDKFNRHNMEHVLEFLGYSINKVDKDIYAELQREPAANEKRYFKVFLGADKIYRCYPYTDNQAYTNIKLMDRFVRSNNISFSVFEYIERKAEDLKFSVPKIITINDLKHYKEMDLTNIARGLGFVEVRSKSTRKYPIYKGKYPDGDDRIIGIKKNPNGEWVAFDNSAGGKLYDCISLVKDYFPKENLASIKNRLDSLTQANNEEQIPAKKIDKSYTYLRNEPVRRYLNLRGFDRTIYDDKRIFKNLLKTEVLTKGDAEYANQVYIVRNVNTLEETGYIRRNISVNSNNLKGFSGEKTGLFFTNYRPGQKTTVLFAESVENGISYYQMNQDVLKMGGQTMIVATGGNPSNEQVKQFKDLILKVNLHNLYLLGDNDVGGAKFNLFALKSLLGEEIINKIQLNKKSQSICIYSYDLNLSDHIKSIPGIKIEQVEDTNLRKMVKACIDYDWEKLNNINNAIIANYLDKRKIVIRNSEHEDFNKDLMIKTGMQEFLDKSKEFNSTENDLLQDPKALYMVDRTKAKKSVQKLAEAIKENRLTYINAIELVKEEGIKLPSILSSQIQVVYKDKAISKVDLYHHLTKNKEKDIGFDR